MAAQKAAKAAMNVATKARHSDAGSYTKGWLDLSDLDGWAVMTLAMIFPLFRGVEHDISAIAVTAITCLTALAGTACNLGESCSEYSHWQEDGHGHLFRAKAPAYGLGVSSAH